MEQRGLKNNEACTTTSAAEKKSGTHTWRCQAFGPEQQQNSSHALSKATMPAEQQKSQAFSPWPPEEALFSFPSFLFCFGGIFKNLS